MIIGSFRSTYWAWLECSSLPSSKMQDLNNLVSCSHWILLQYFSVHLLGILVEFPVDKTLHYQTGASWLFFYLVCFNSILLISICSFSSSIHPLLTLPIRIAHSFAVLLLFQLGRFRISIPKLDSLKRYRLILIAKESRLSAVLRFQEVRRKQVVLQWSHEHNLLT